MRHCDRDADDISPHFESSVGIGCRFKMHSLYLSRCAITHSKEMIFVCRCDNTEQERRLEEQQRPRHFHTSIRTHTHMVWQAPNERATFK